MFSLRRSLPLVALVLAASACSGSDDAAPGSTGVGPVVTTTAPSTVPPTAAPTPTTTLAPHPCSPEYVAPVDTGLPLDTAPPGPVVTVVLEDGLDAAAQAMLVATDARYGDVPLPVLAGRLRVDVVDSTPSPTWVEAVALGANGEELWSFTVVPGERCPCASSTATVRGDEYGCADDDYVGWIEAGATWRVAGYAGRSRPTLDEIESWQILPAV